MYPRTRLVKMWTLGHVSQKNVFLTFLSYAKQKWERVEFIGVFRSKFAEYDLEILPHFMGKADLLLMKCRHAGPVLIFVQKNDVNKNGIDAKL